MPSTKAVGLPDTFAIDVPDEQPVELADYLDDESEAPPPLPVKVEKPRPEIHVVANETPVHDFLLMANMLPL